MNPTENRSQKGARRARERRRLGVLGVLLCALTTLHCSNPGSGPGSGPTPEPEAAPVALAISPSNPQVAHETAQAFTVQGLFADGQSQDVTARVRWTVRDAAGHTMPTSADGILPFAQPGRYVVTAEYAGRALSTPVMVTAATLSSISVSPSTPKVPKGMTKAFTATAKFSDGTTQDVTKMAAWSVKDTVGTNVATVDTTGVATATEVGKTRVSARFMTKSSYTTMEVTPATLLTLAVSPSSPTIAKGTSEVFTARGTFSDGSVTDLTSLVTWAVADVMGSGVASIDSSGKAFGKAQGVAAVSAEYLDIVTETRLTVTAAAVASLSLTPGSASIAKGTTQRFTAVASLTDATTQDVTAVAAWSAMDLDGIGVASVDSSGTARGNNIGRSRIRVTYGGKSVESVLQVTPAVLTALAVEPASTSIALGLSKSLRAVGTYSDGSTLDLSASVLWSATDVTGTSVVSVTSTGLVIGLARGQARIDATFATRTASTLVEVTGAVVTSLAVTPASVTIAKGTTQQFTATASLSDGSKQDVSALATWVIRDVSGTGVASVDSKGLASAKALGTAELQVTHAGFEMTAQLIVSEFSIFRAMTTNNIWGIWGAAEDDIWSVGALGTVLHWDGTSWKSEPSGYTGYVSSVWGSGSKDVWFGCENGSLLHWDGSKISTVSTGLTGWALGLWGSGASDIWAVDSNTLTHWNGTTWTTSRLPSGVYGYALWGTGPRDVWAAGSGGATAHFDGTSWTSVRTPATESLWGIGGSGPRDVWAVGNNGTIVRYDGTAWNKIPSPKTSWLVSVASRGPSDAWIAGWDGTILRWDGSRWLTVPVPTTEHLLGTWLGPTSVWISGFNGLTLRR